MPQEKLPEFIQTEHFVGEKPFFEEITAVPEQPQVDFLRQRIETALQQQLLYLGHNSENKQLEFISNMLGEEKKSMSSLNPLELRQLLNKIIEQREKVVGKNMPQSA